MILFDIHNPNFYILLSLSLINTIFMCFVSHKFLQIIQICSYKIGLYIDWVKDTKAKWISRIAFLSFLCFLGMFVCNVLFRNYGDYKLLTYLGLIFYFWFMIVYIINMKNVPEKKKLVVTKRVARIYILLSIVMFAITYGLLLISFNFKTAFRFSLVALTPLFVPIIVPLVVAILNPLEKLINKGYVRKARRKLKKAEPIIKIGITGSYGKTSTKQFLTHLLSKKYNVVCTPESYNTPMGITKTINKLISKETQIFVCEMGADHVGDINTICKIFKPDIALITAIGNQHLKTFGSFENIVKTKYEIVENLSQDGLAFFNGENANARELYEKSDYKNKILVDFNADVKFTNFIMNKGGIKFDMIIDDKKYPCKSKLIGEHNLQNILMAVNVALKLKVEPKDIVKAIEELKPVYHRLELKYNDNGIITIDDSFNSNEMGCIYALNTLAMFKSNRKIILTPGLVEMGEKEFEINEKFGEMIATCCDICVIVNNYNKEAIKKGLLSKGFNPKKIYEVESLYLATELFKTILKKGDVVLIENDLPDNYR